MSCESHLQPKNEVAPASALKLDLIIGGGCELDVQQRFQRGFGRLGMKFSQIGNQEVVYPGRLVGWLISLRSYIRVLNLIYGRYMSEEVSMERS
jgi:hypothetical protein